METLKQAKQHLRDNWEKGTSCPCCGQMVKLYSRPMHHMMTAALIQLYHLDKKKSGYYHVSELSIGKTYTSVGDFAKLKYWGLIEQRPKGDGDENKRTSGYWRITQRGIQFVLGQRTEPQRALMFNKKHLGFAGEQITIRQALGKKFNYEELMNN